MVHEGQGEPFRLAFVAGVTPDKWVRRWRDRYPEQPVEPFLVDQRHQVAVLRDGTASMSLVRLPVDTEGLHLIPLYTEIPVVVVAKDHVVAAFERVHVHDLVDERHWDLAEVTAKEAVEAVAGGTGVVVLPQSVARLHHRKDVVAVPVDGVAETEVGLAWRVADEDPRLEQMIGIVRGRTERSSRGPVADQAPAQSEGVSKAPRGTSPGKRRGTSPGKPPDPPARRHRRG